MAADRKLRFRFNTLTGEVETFEVDQESSMPADEHDREHDRFAAELGRLLARDPRVAEVAPEDGAAASPVADEPARGTGKTPDSEAESQRTARRRQGG